MQTKAELIAQLQREIISLEGLKAPLGSDAFDAGLSFLRDTFPASCFPLRAVHEFFCSSAEDVSATNGFISGILSSLLKRGGTAIWIGANRTLFPPALVSFGIRPETILFIDLKNEKEVLWAFDEALKCPALTAVIGELSNFSFTASRRFQLAVESSRATGFLLRCNPRNLITASVTRWKVSSIRSETENGLPGLGFPRWKVELLKVRNGKPGVWQVEWKDCCFQPVYQPAVIQPVLHKKAG